MTKQFLLSLFLLSLSCVVFAQDSDSKKAAKDLVEISKEILLVQKAPDQARESFIAAASLDPTNIEANWSLAGPTFNH